MKITNVEGIRKEQFIEFLNQVEGNPLIKFTGFDIIDYTWMDYTVVSMETQENNGETCVILTEDSL